MQCQHCDEIVTLPDISQHECFVEQEINADDPSSLSVGKKQPAIWDLNTTLALLSLYEAKKGMLDHPKKKGRIWEAISTDLQQDFGIEMSMDQVRWKMNALINKYKECVDNNSKSGRNPMSFKWFDQMDEIFNQGKDVTNHCFSTKFVHTSKPSTLSKPSASSKLSTSSMKKVNSKSTSKLIARNNSDTLLQHCSNENSQNSSTSTSPMLNKKTNSKGLSNESNRHMTTDKVVLEKQWLEYMKMKVEQDKVSNEKHASALEQKKETLKLKRKNLALKEEEIKQRKEYFTAKLKGKENRHAEIITIEKQKYKLLRKFLTVNSSDSE